jgi:hypothetical protein
MRTKYKGHHNRNTQIRGTFSASGDALVCGSDDGWAYVWPTDAPTAAGTAAGSSKRVRHACCTAWNTRDTIRMIAG